MNKFFAVGKKGDEISLSYKRRRGIAPPVGCCRRILIHYWPNRAGTIFAAAPGQRDAPPADRALKLTIQGAKAAKRETPRETNRVGRKR